MSWEMLGNLAIGFCFGVAAYALRAGGLVAKYKMDSKVKDEEADLWRKDSQKLSQEKLNLLRMVEELRRRLELLGDTYPKKIWVKAFGPQTSWQVYELMLGSPEETGFSITPQAGPGWVSFVAESPHEIIPK